MIAESDDLWAVGDAIVTLSVRRGFVRPRTRGSGAFIRELSDEMKSRSGAKRTGEFTLRQFRDTAWAYETHERRGSVDFYAHAEVRNRDDRDEFLDWYEEQATQGKKPKYDDYLAYARGREGPDAPGTFTTYRFYGTDRQLLYVGRDSNWPRRRRVHSRRSPWWGEVAEEVVVHHSTREAMIRDENRALREESPLYNAAGERS